jgi:hypothetical protein
MPGVDLPSASTRKLGAALYVLLTDSDETPGRAVNLQEKHAFTADLDVPPLQKSKARGLCAGNQHSRLVCSETKRREPDAGNRSLG